MKTFSNILSIALIGCGATGFVIASKPLLASKEADAPLNVLGINRSPYGEVFAMAMQVSIESHFHATDAPGHVCEDGCDHENTKEIKAVANLSLDKRLLALIEEMEIGLIERTNPRGASQAHKFYLRREIEDKLRFAYNLDPSHYGNYNAYHFFLTEPQLGTRPELTPHAARLADQTITYCLSQRNDPRQALTAAAAAGNVIELMFNDRHINSEKPRFTTAQMKNCLKVMDQSLGLYALLANDWADKKLWANLSEHRLAETQERYDFVLKIRDTHEQAIRRLEGLSDNGNTAGQTTTNPD